MPDTWTTNLQHFLNHNGEIGPSSGPARRLAEYMASIIDAATRYDDQVVVRCRRRPGRRPCRTELEIWTDRDTDDIHWLCPACGDSGLISDWQHSRWDHAGRFSEASSPASARPPSRARVGSLQANAAMATMSSDSEETSATIPRTMANVRLLDVPEKRQIDVEEAIPVHLTIRERDLILDYGLLDSEIRQKLKEGRVTGRSVACFLTLSDIDILLGDVAAAGRHARDEEVSELMEACFDWLRLYEDLYADEESSPTSMNEIRLSGEAFLMLQTLAERKGGGPDGSDR